MIRDMKFSEPYSGVCFVMKNRIDGMVKLRRKTRILLAGNGTCAPGIIFQSHQKVESYLSVKNLKLRSEN